jgi:hypothetical protein
VCLQFPKPDNVFTNLFPTFEVVFKGWKVSNFFFKVTGHSKINFFVGLNWVMSNYTWVGAEELFWFELVRPTIPGWERRNCSGLNWVMSNYTWVGVQELFWFELGNVQLYLGGSGGTVLVWTGLHPTIPGWERRNCSGLNWVMSNSTWVGVEELFWFELGYVQLYLGGSGGTVLVWTG